MCEPKISIITPIYKVEPYLRKCLNSIVHQTYRNLDIILVDDGSPDNCGGICDEFAAMDERIRVIHKENGGVSSARNAGLTAAEGEWIGWVDPDDWIEPDMFEYLLKKALESGADIAVCGRCEQYKDHRVPRAWEREELLSTEDALGLLLKNDVMQNFLWDKLWRRELFDGITFPEGKTYEDVTVMHRLFERAERVICLPEVKYNYFLRSGSILGDTSLRNRIDYYEASKARYEDMRERWPRFSAQMEGQCVAAAIGIWGAYYSCGREERGEFDGVLHEIADFSRKHYKDALQYIGLGAAGRIIVPLTRYVSWWAFSLARLCGWVYKVRHGRAL